MGTRSGAVMDRETPMPVGLIEKWATAAAARAVVEPMEAPDGFYAEVADAPGAWGYGKTKDEALSVLHSVLVGWASLKLADGDTDIPVMGGVGFHNR